MECKILFDLAFVSLNKKFEGKNNINKLVRIYKITDSNENIYIGSTAEDLQTRLEKHKQCIKDTSQYSEQNKFYKYARDNNITLSISLILEREFSSQLEVELTEDYYIFQMDSINKGHNSKYNTTIAITLTNNDLSIQNKCKTINNYIEKYSTGLIEYREYLLKNKELINKLQNINDIDLNDSGWIEYKNVLQYNPLFLVNGHIGINDGDATYSMINTKLNNNVTGVYLFYWNNNKYIKTFCNGGISSIFNYDKISFRELKIIKYIIAYGKQFMIYPLAYTSYCDDDKLDTSRYMSNIKKIINLRNIHEIMKNKHALLTEIYSVDELMNFIDVMTLSEKYSSSIELYNYICDRDNIRNSKIINDYNDIFRKKQKIKLCELQKDMKIKQSDIIIKQNNQVLTNVKAVDEKIHIEIQGKNIKIEIKNNVNEQKKIDTTNEKEIIFHSKPGRPTQYKTADERKQAKLQAKKDWRNKNKDRVSEYNKKYREVT